MTQIIDSDGDVIVDEIEAQALEDEIARTSDRLRMLVYTMWRKSGYAALGFSEWTTYLKERLAPRCKKTWQSLYRDLAAAQIEAEAGVGIGDNAEGTLRHITGILSTRRGFGRHDQAEALLSALEMGDGEVTKENALVASQKIFIEKQAPATAAPLAAKVKSGRVDVPSAFAILNTIINATPDIHDYLANMKDPDLAERVSRLRTAYDDTWFDLEEYLRVGTVPTFNGKQKPINSATISDLNGWLRAPAHMEQIEERVEREEGVQSIAVTARKIYTHMYGSSPPPRMSGDLWLELYDKLHQAGMI